MAVRIRKDGRIVCAASHVEKSGDLYIDDNIHYYLSVEAKVLVTDDNHIDGHGEWWWINDVPLWAITTTGE